MVNKLDNVQNQQTKKGSRIPALLFSATGLTAATCLLYLSGRAFHRGYDAAFGLDSSMFPYDWAETLAQAWQAFSYLGSKFIWWGFETLLYLIAPLIAAGALIDGIRWLSKKLPKLAAGYMKCGICFSSQTPNRRKKQRGFRRT